MSKKLLFISNIIGEGVGSFSAASIKAAKELGFEYHMAANFNNSTPERIREDEKNYGITIHHIDFVRQPYDLRNYRAYKQVVDLINKMTFDVIHCNTPIGGVVGRLAGKKCKVETIIYQAHGFHFYKGAPLKNWFIYYPIEKWLAHYTDALITINMEYYNRANEKFHLRKGGKVYYVPGVGIDTALYESRTKVREEKRAELGLRDSDIMIISAGDLIERKNNKTSIEAIAKADNPDLQYFICGQGPQEEELRKLIHDRKLNRQVHLLGYRTDMKELFQAADIFLFTTLQEGLPRSMMEAMASGLPCIASNIRGNSDLLTEECGYLVDATDYEGFSEIINKLASNAELRHLMGVACMERMHSFDSGAAEAAVQNVYKNEVGGY